VIVMDAVRFWLAIALMFLDNAKTDSLAAAGLRSLCLIFYSASVGLLAGSSTVRDAAHGGARWA
jgi:hypothetical protein